MKLLGLSIPALFLVLGVAGCGSAVPPDQADGSDCNFAESATACHTGSFCDPGEPGPDGNFLRKKTYGFTGDKMHVVGTCRPKGASGAACGGADQCQSGVCEHKGPAPKLGEKGTCK